MRDKKKKEKKGKFEIVASVARVHVVGEACEVVAYQKRIS